jgi:hypothetical protein
MATIADQRYTVAPGEGGWDVIDATTGKCVGSAPDLDAAGHCAQALGALIGANETRFKRARIKREIKGCATPVESREACAAVIEDNPQELASMRLTALLLAVRYHRSERIRDTLRFAACTDSKDTEVVDAEVVRDEPMTRALATTQPVTLAVTPDVDASELVARLDVIREAMNTAMVQGVDYGVIPGTGSKPTLLKPGAEKLGVLFQLDVQLANRRRGTGST